MSFVLFMLFWGVFWSTICLGFVVGKFDEEKYKPGIKYSVFDIMFSLFNTFAWSYAIYKYFS